MRTPPLSCKARYRAVAIPGGPLGNKLFHISPSYWTNYRSFEIILLWGLSIGLEFKFNAVCKSIASWKHSIWYEIYL